jgi:hypothetical protein
VWAPNASANARAANLQCASGIAPVTKQSGKKRHVHRRYRCSEFFKQSFHEWAAESRFFSAWAQAYYQMKRAGAMGHHAAVRAQAEPLGAHQHVRANSDLHRHIAAWE